MRSRDSFVAVDAVIANSPRSFGETAAIVSQSTLLPMLHDIRTSETFASRAGEPSGNSTRPRIAFVFSLEADLGATGVADGSEADVVDLRSLNFIVPRSIVCPATTATLVLTANASRVATSE